MSAPVITRPSLLEVVLDALTDAYWYRKSEVEGCGFCRQNPAGVCADPDHQHASALALEYEEARKQIEHGSDGEVLALLNGKGER